MKKPAAGAARILIFYGYVPPSKDQKTRQGGGVSIAKGRDSDYNLIALQASDTDDLEGCEFSSKFRAETIGNMEKLMACVKH